MLCPFCKAPAELVTGDVYYPHRPDLANRKIWRCIPCAASVGCHPGTETPQGGLATKDTRAARMQAHAAFDPLWQKKMACAKISKGVARREAYRWLAEQMGIPPEQCHIGMMTAYQARLVVAICKRRKVKTETPSTEVG